MACKILLLPRSHFDHKYAPQGLNPLHFAVVVHSAINRLRAGLDDTPAANQRSVLKEDLYNLRTAIDEFTQDKGLGPESLDELVHAGYLHELPLDPITKSRSTWQMEFENSIPTNGRASLRIIDVHSGSHANSSEGTRYDSW